MLWRTLCDKSSDTVLVLTFLSLLFQTLQAVDQLLISLSPGKMQLCDSLSEWVCLFVCFCFCFENTNTTVVYLLVYKHKSCVSKTGSCTFHSLRKQQMFREVATWALAKRHLSSKCRSSIPMMCTTQILVVLLIGWKKIPSRHNQSEALPRLGSARRQYGNLEKHRLFSQVTPSKAVLISAKLYCKWWFTVKTRFAAIY